VGTPLTAGLPALMAATYLDSEGGRMYGPSGFQHVGGAPDEQRLYKPLRDEEEARRVWSASEKLAGVTFPAPEPGVRLAS